MTLYGNAAASESVLETTVLQNNYTDMAASGVLVLINTFCMHNGTDLEVRPASRALINFLENKILHSCLFPHVMPSDM